MKACSTFCPACDPIPAAQLDTVWGKRMLLHPQRPGYWVSYSDHDYATEQPCAGEP